MQRLSTKLATLALLLSFSFGAQAQELGELLSDVGSSYGSMYTTPLTNSLGADLNSGLFHTAKSNKGLFGLNVYFGIKVAGMFVNESDQLFDLQFPSTVNFDYTVNGQTYDFEVPVDFAVTGAPTIFGNRESALATGTVRFDTTIVDGGINYPVSIDTTFSQEIIGGLISTKIAPIAIPHASFGSLLGTDITVRWLPEVSHPEFGHVKLIGGGIRHSLNRYIDSLPIDLAVAATWQQLETGSSVGGDFNMNINTFAYSVIASKSLMLVTVYGGLQREKSTVEYSYTLAEAEALGEPVDVNFSHTGSQKGRMTVGVALHLGPIVTNADYAVGNERVASLGFGIGF